MRAIQLEAGSGVSGSVEGMLLEWRGFGVAPRTDCGLRDGITELTEVGIAVTRGAVCEAAAGVSELVRHAVRVACCTSELHMEPDQRRADSDVSGERRCAHGDLEATRLCLVAGGAAPGSLRQERGAVRRSMALGAAAHGHIAARVRFDLAVATAWVTCDAAQAGVGPR